MLSCKYHSFPFSERMVKNKINSDIKKKWLTALFHNCTTKFEQASDKDLKEYLNKKYNFMHRLYNRRQRYKKVFNTDAGD